MPVSLYTPSMGAWLLVAAGGGGDAIAAVMVARMLGMGSAACTSPPSRGIACWSTRFLGLVVGSGSRGLRPVGGYNFQVTPGSAVRAPAGSLLPRLAAELPATLYLLDASEGAAGLGAQPKSLQGSSGPIAC